MKYTPWGQSDSEVKLADGIISYSTPSHGGIWLSAQRQKQLPENIDNFTHDIRWWEEDCDWCVPYILFKDDIEAYGEAYHFTANLNLAYVTARRFHPGVLNN